jgi:hypothetical protein
MKAILFLYTPLLILSIHLVFFAGKLAGIISSGPGEVGHPFTSKTLFRYRGGKPQ